MTQRASRAAVEIEWIEGLRAAEILGVKRAHIRNLARAGHLTERKIPCHRPEYRRDEIERLARESVKPATATATAQG